MTDLPVRSVARYGWKPSLPDARDLIADLTGVPYIPEVDPRKAMPAVYDQGQLGSCTANAVAAAFEYDLLLDHNHFGTPSRLFIYYLERLIEGSPADSDTGAYGRDGFKAIHKIGSFREALWPYDESKFSIDPRPHVYDDPSHHKLNKDYRAVPRSVTSWKRALSNGQTIAFGFSVYSSFESAQVDHTGIVPYPNIKTEQMVGGHEMLCVGYLERYPAYALVRNSWSDGWGLAGYCLFPWSILMDRSMSSDARTIRRPLL